MKKIFDLIKYIREYFYVMYLTSPILNPTVSKIQPITKKSRLGNKTTGYRLMARDHLFDRWRVIGDFKSFKAAMSALLED